MDLAKAGTALGDKRYSYQSLDHTRREIRLIVLHPGERFSSQVTCDILTVALQEEPKYMALSYSWGDESNPICIKIGNEYLPVTQNLYAALRRIRRNFYGGEVQAKVVILWIDAICIDQSNKEEKGFQVPLMADIYKSARLTVVWLGEAAAHSDLAIALLKAWGTRSEEEDSVRDFEQVLQSCSFATKPQALSAVRALLQRSWWNRLWVFQEYALSHDVVFLCGSSSLWDAALTTAFISWRSFEQSPHAASMENRARVSMMGITRFSSFPYLLAMRLRRRRNRSPEAFKDKTVRRPAIDHMSLLQLIQQTRSFDATDPRDKIYGVLGLDEVKDIVVKPRYGDPVAKVYTDFAVELIQTTSSLAILQMAGAGLHQGPPCERDAALPSWVPEFRCPGLDDLTESDVANEYSRAITIEPSRRLLSAIGFQCGVVQFVSIGRHAGEEPSPSTRFTQWANFILNSGVPHPTGSSQVYALFRTICCHIFTQSASSSSTSPRFIDEEHHKRFFDLATGFLLCAGIWAMERHQKQNPQNSWSQYEKWSALMINNSIQAQGLQTFLLLLDPSRLSAEPVEMTDEEILESFAGSMSTAEDCSHPLRWPDEYQQITDGELNSIESRFQMEFYQRAQYQSLFVTETGYIGFGPAQVEVGDKLCILGGGRAPMLLRRDGSDDHYMLVGSTSVFGLMHGEAVEKLEAGDYTEEKFVIR